MRIMIAAPSAVAGSISLVLFALGQPRQATVAKVKTVEKKSAVQNVEMTVGAQPSRPAGEAVCIDVRLRNAGKQIVRHGPTDGTYGDFAILVTDGDGKPAPVTRFGRRVSVTKKSAGFHKFNPKPIRPGGAVWLRFNLMLLFDLSLPGKYRVTVATDIYPAKSKDPHKGFEVKIPELEFEVGGAASVWVKSPTRRPTGPS